MTPDQLSPPATTYKEPVSKAAIASLIFGICGGWIAGVIFGAIALRNIRQDHLRGRWIAIAGLVLSIVWCGVLTVAVIDRRLPMGANFDPRVATQRELGTLDVGTCVNAPLTKDEATHVRCADPHDAEVTATFSLNGDTYPADTIEASALSGCQAALRNYAPNLTDAEAEQLTIHALYPAESTWRFSGARLVTCLVRKTVGQLTQSIKQGL